MFCMRKLFLGISIAFAAILSGCSKSSNSSYEAIYYILMSGPSQVSISNSEIKSKVDIIIEDWKQNSELTWRVKFSSSDDSSIATEDQKAVNYFRERVSAFDSALKDVREEILASNVEVDHAWHFSICRDKSSNTLAPSLDVYLQNQL